VAEPILPVTPSTPDSAPGAAASVAGNTADPLPSAPATGAPGPDTPSSDTPSSTAATFGIDSSGGPERLIDLPTALEELVTEGLITQRQAEDVLISPRTKKELSQHPLEIIAARDYELANKPGHKLTLDLLTERLSLQAGQEWVRIDPLKINVNACTEVMSYAFAQRHNILAIGVLDDEVIIASAQPFMSAWEGMLTQTLRGRTITRVVANPEDLTRYQLEFYTVARSVAKAGESGLELSGVGNLEQMLELGAMKSPEANDAHIVNIVDWLLQYAFEQRASDIHIEPRREKGLVRFRIDGVMPHVYELPSVVNAAVTSRLKILGRMDVAEKRRPQDGRVKTKAPDGDEVELRLSTLPTAFGEKMVMRIFDPDVLLRSHEELGLAGEDYKRWTSMTAQPNGIILVTGPTGSGKTTTLYSTLKALATSAVNVCTIEDPIEMVEPAFNQMQVQHNIDLTFASGVRALLRQDPDIIMVGEIRDLETAEISIKAAQTGHMVLSTLHTNSAAETLTRLRNMGVPAFNLATSVTLIIAQRLARRLCTNCKTKIDVPAPALKEEGFTDEDIASGFEVFGPNTDGCDSCSSGYKGRVGIYEVVKITPELSRIIMEDGNSMDLAKQAQKHGFNDLRRSSLEKVMQGVTSLAEANRVTTGGH